jgi:hypothetical protein
MLYSEVRSGFDQFIQISRDFLIVSFNASITPHRFFNTALLTRTIANLETPSITSFRGGGSGVRFIFSPISCLFNRGAFQCPRNSHVHHSAKFRRGSPRLITNVVISFHGKRTEFRAVIRQLGQALRMKTQKCTRSHGRTGRNVVDLIGKMYIDRNSPLIN